MAAKKRGLGRGLDALLGSAKRQERPAPEPGPAAELKAVPVPEVVDTPVDGALRALPVDVIQRGEYQPRVDMHQESLQDLADSIAAQGVVQPIVVRSIGENRYEIIAGGNPGRAA